MTTTPDRDRRLSAAEIRILRAAADGKTVDELARYMRCTSGQLAYRRRKLQRRLAARNITQAVAIAIEAGLLGGPPRPIDPIGPKQRSLLYVLWGRLDRAREGNAHDEALRAASLRAGRELTSVNELSYEQASDTIEWTKAQLAELEVPA